MEFSLRKKFDSLQEECSRMHQFLRNHQSKAKSGLEMTRMENPLGLQLAAGMGLNLCTIWKHSIEFWDLLCVSFRTKGNWRFMGG